MTPNQKIAVGVVAGMAILCLLCSCLALGFAIGQATTTQPTIIYKYRPPEGHPKPWEFFWEFKGPLFGRVVKVERESLVVRTDDDKVKVEVDRDTTILRWGEEINLDEVEPGDRVVILGKWEDEDVISARMIMIMPGRGWD
jgi:hypothetical protein